MSNTVPIEVSLVGIRCLSENFTQMAFLPAPPQKNLCTSGKEKSCIKHSIAEQVGEAKALNKAVAYEGSI